jgi:hypothetical protein
VLLVKKLPVRFEIFTAVRVMLLFFWVLGAV